MSSSGGSPLHPSDVTEPQASRAVSMVPAHPQQPEQLLLHGLNTRQANQHTRTCVAQRVRRPRHTAAALSAGSPGAGRQVWQGSRVSQPCKRGAHIAHMQGWRASAPNPTLPHPSPTRVALTADAEHVLQAQRCQLERPLVGKQGFPALQGWRAQRDRMPSMFCRRSVASSNGRW